MESIIPSIHSSIPPITNDRTGENNPDDIILDLDKEGGLFTLLCTAHPDLPVTYYFHLLSY